MANPVLHFEVLGNDAEGLQKFYASAFGWKIVATAVPNYAMVLPEGGGINGGIGKAMNGAGHVTFYAEVADLEATLKKIEQLGGKRIMGPDAIPGGPTIALFTDPEGHVIGLVGAGTRRTPRGM